MAKLLYMFLLLTSFIFGGTFLLKPQEKLIFGFKSKSGKVVTIALGPKKSYLVYRFGKKNRVEFEYPKDKKNSFSKFSYYHYMRPSLGNTNAGLDISDLSFTNKGYTYTVYDEYSDEDGHSIGVKVFKGEKEIANIKGLVKSKKGTLLTIEDLIENDGLPIKYKED